jgi:ribose 5-phosphate isomerase B
MIYLGSDHGGFALKQKIKDFLKKEGYEFDDLGNVADDKSDDYPDYAFPVAERVGQADPKNIFWKERPKGILICKSAAGVVIAANKVKNVRAVAAFDVKSAVHSRKDNDANILALSALWTKEKEAEMIVKAWLTTEFSNAERHIRRINKIKEYENEKH